MVVDFAIDGHGSVMIAIDDRLGSGIEADNGQSLMGQNAVPEAGDTVPVGSSMPQ